MKSVLEPQTTPVDFDQAIRYFELIRKETDDIFIFAIPAKGASGPVYQTRFTLKELRTRPTLRKKLEDWNRTHGIYVYVNPGGTLSKDIHDCVAFFWEWDDIS